MSLTRWSYEWNWEQRETRKARFVVNVTGCDNKSYQFYDLVRVKVPEGCTLKLKHPKLEWLAYELSWFVNSSICDKAPVTAYIWTDFKTLLPYTSRFDLTHRFKWDVLLTHTCTKSRTHTLSVFWWFQGE